MNTLSNSNDDKAKLDAEKVVSTLSHTLWAQKLYNEAMRDLIVFGTSTPYIYKKPTLWQRVKWPVRDFLWRCRDAWKVLTGKAEIYEGQDD